MGAPHARPTARRAAEPGRLRTPAGLLAVALFVSACGGGDSSDGVGGGGSPSSEPYQWGLGTIRAYQGYARLADEEGSGVQPGGDAAVIGMIDSGIDQDHPLLAGKTITEQLLDGAEDETGKTRGSHGTAVASLIVGERSSGDRAHGVAWGARLAVFAIPLGTAIDAPYEPISLNDLASADTDDAAVFRTVLDWRTTGGEPIDFLNLSFGYSGLISGYTETDLTTDYLTTIDVLKQADRTASNLDKTILVWAAGNSHGEPCTANAGWCVDGKVVASSPEVLSGLMVRIGDLQDHSIAVAALGRDGRIADFSNRCGDAASWCITAPGEEMRVAYFGPHPDDRQKPEDERRVIRGVGTARGTSFAAPMVTGGLAVMKHLFRDQLSSTALVTRLFETADDGGRYSDSSVYGHGVMDLGAATAPVGATQLALGDRVEGPGSPVQETRLDLGGTLGDGFARAFAGREIAAFDTLGAPFWFKLGDFASEPDGLSMMERLRDLMAPVPDPHPLGARRFSFSYRREGADTGTAPTGAYRLDFGILATPAGAGGGLLGLAERAATLSLAAGDRLAFTAFSSLGIDGVDPALGGTLSWRPNGAKLGLRAGWLAERDAMLGTSAQGAFGRLTAHSAFAGVERETEIGGWRVAGGAEIGVVNPSRHGGLFTDVSPLATSAFSLRATRPLDDDTSFRLSISQPLRVESGRATLSIPTGRTKGGDVLRRTVTADLSPTGRQLDVDARWHRRTRSGGDLRLGAGWTLQPGHRADADPSLTLLAGWRRAF